MVNFSTKLLQGVFYERGFYRVVFYAVLSRRLRSNIPAWSSTEGTFLLHIVLRTSRLNQPRSRFSGNPEEANVNGLMARCWLLHQSPANESQGRGEQGEVQITVQHLVFKMKCFFYPPLLSPIYQLNRLKLFWTTFCAAFCVHICTLKTNQKYYNPI